MDIRERIARWLWTPATPPTSAGALREYVQGVSDGVDYRAPFLLPGHIRREMQHDPDLRKMVESAASNYQTPFGTPYESSDKPFRAVTEDPLLEWDYATRERVLSTCHAAYHRNPLANSIVQFTTQFVVGDGFNLVCKNKDVERLLNEFIDHPDNNIREYERQAVNDLQVDGELILRFFEQGGQVVMVPQRPWELESISTEKGFFRRFEVFTFQRYETEGDDPAGQMDNRRERVKAEEILFVAINRHGYELRGRPELYRLLPWLEADRDFLSDRVMQSKWRGALLWHVRVLRATPAIVANVMNRWKRPPNPGSAYVSTDNEEVIPLTNSANAGDASNDGRSIRLMNIMGARLPEYFFADGQNSNLATAKKQELPALTKFEAFQQILIEQLWTPAFKRVIQAAIDAGNLTPEVEVQDSEGDPIVEEPPTMERGQDPDEPNDEAPGTAETCNALEAFEVTYEPVTGDDLNTLAQAYATMAGQGWVDDQTAMEKLGLDVRQVEKRLEKQRQKQVDEMAMGMRPIPPGQVPPGMEDNMSNDNQPPEENAA